MTVATIDARPVDCDILSMCREGDHLYHQATVW
jgi:hypothetical protein